MNIVHGHHHFFKLNCSSKTTTMSYVSLLLPRRGRPQAHVTLIPNVMPLCLDWHPAPPNSGPIPNSSLLTPIYLRIQDTQH
jgi:hypothetical protein